MTSLYCSLSTRKDERSADEGGRTRGSRVQLKRYDYDSATARLGLLVTDGFDGAWLETMLSAMATEGVEVDIIGIKPGLLHSFLGAPIRTDETIQTAKPSDYDAIALAPSDDEATLLERDEEAMNWVKDALDLAHDHRVLFAFRSAASLLVARTGAEPDRRITQIDDSSAARAWATRVAREPKGLFLQAG